MTAASPGVIALFLPNQHYPSDEDYIAALADAMKAEYDAIHAARDSSSSSTAPTSPMGWPIVECARASPIDEFRQIVPATSRPSNHATRDIPPDGMRMHLCWGNYEGPHHHDIALRRLLDIVLAARPAGFLFEGANPRHEHEWVVFEEVELPEGKMLIPGVLDSTTNYIEHPELVAQRIEPLRRHRGPRERDGRQRLRLRHLRAGAAGRPEDHVGQARGDGRGRPPRLRAPVG